MNTYSIIWLTHTTGLPWEAETWYPSDRMAVECASAHLRRLKAEDCDGFQVWRHGSEGRGSARLVATITRSVATEVKLEKEEA